MTGPYEAMELGKALVDITKAAKVVCKRVVCLAGELKTNWYNATHIIRARKRVDGKNGK